MAPIWRLKPIRLLTTLTGQKLVMPFYHAVEDNPRPHLMHAYSVKSSKEFESDLDALLRHFEPVDTDTLIRLTVNGEKPSKPSFWLSFDDGLSSFYAVAAPVLKRKGIPAACFINTAFIDNKDLFYRYKASLLTESADQLDNHTVKNIAEKLKVKSDSSEIKNRIQRIRYKEKKLLDEIAGMMGFNFAAFLNNEQPYLTFEQIKSLIDDGFTIGAHSVDHPRFSEISMDEQLKQTELSVSELKTKFNVEPVLFSFPFTDDGITTGFFNRIKENPGSPVLTFGTAGMKWDQISSNLQRIPMEFNHASALDIVRMEYVYYVLKSFAGKNLLKRN
ncbi:polysaccharide deacetylase family protein [Saccharicrinis sp. FJH54]|uniref:polysaccharide deacetylase family protein n=1 Tax=Saccharicrinis sp. FJH54 TaxID=3344665 RepID=UPI0035D41B5B